MNQLKFADYDMRSDFEFHVHVSSELYKIPEVEYWRINRIESIPGVLKKEGEIITLELAEVLKKPDYKYETLITDDEDLVTTEKDFKTLYATTWDGKIQFTINKYHLLFSQTQMNFNSIPCRSGTYRVTDFTLASQFNLDYSIYQASFYFDHIHEWFSIYSPQMVEKVVQFSAIRFEKLKFKEALFSLDVNGVFGERGDMKEIVLSADSVITVKFSEPQSKELVFDLGMQLRNFFQFILGKKVGLYKIILNKDNSWNGKTLQQKDERENWIVSQSFLPPKPNKNSRIFDIKYSTVKDDLEKVLSSFLESDKLQDFTSRFLAVSQYQMPVTPVLLTLTSAVESYLCDKEFENGNLIRDLKKKLNIVFNNKIEDDKSTKETIQIIKDNRDYYIHGVKPDKKQSETDLVPTINRFIVAVRKFLIQEIFHTQDKETTN